MFSAVPWFGRNAAPRIMPHSLTVARLPPVRKVIVVSAHTLAPPATAAGLEGAAKRFAIMPQAEAETVIDAHVADALRAWRIADATVWQRVKFRSRMIRTANAHRCNAQEGS